MATDEQLSQLLKKYALLNSTSHNGKAEQGAVVGRIMSEHAELRSESKRIFAMSSAIVREVNSLSLQDQISVLNDSFGDALASEMQRKKEKSRRDSEKLAELPELPGVTVGEVVTRFPPEPNGFMHIGHAKAAILGSEYAKKYKGRFIMRFDDTNPAAEKREYYDAFLDSFAWLHINPDVIKNSSDDIEKFYSIAERLIFAGKAYVCACPQQRMKELRAAGEPCSHRSNSATENLDLWKKMLSKELGRNEATLRFVGDMRSLNTAMRDPVLFRIIDDSHPLLGKKYHVWPTYDFAGPIEDSLDGVTHAMRSKEYELRDEQYHAILDSLGLEQPTIIEFSRLNLHNTTVHKRTLRPLIEERLVEGWDDPRLPTISGLRRRGFLAEAIKQFILSMGVSKVESEPTWDLLESFNRRLLDPISRRFFFIPDPVELLVEHAPDRVVSLRYHPDREEYGERKFHLNDRFFVPSKDAAQFTEGSKIRLIEAYNVEIKNALRKGSVIASYAGEEKMQDISKIQWVPGKENVSLNVMIPGPLLIDERFNPDSLQQINGLIEESGAQIEMGEITQFVRFGFCRMDKQGIAIRAHK
jgi:glutamyl-tRNA synthetase